MPNSLQENLLPLIEKVLERLDSLERRMAAVENQRTLDDFDAGDEGNSDYFVMPDAEPQVPAKPAPKRGRRPLVSLEDGERRRDELVQFLEVRWPALQRGFNRRCTLESLGWTLDQGSPGADDMPAYRRLRENIATLWEFLHSGRYNGEPRQIAYAMAAVPELTWRSSLDRFTTSPSPLPIHIRAHAEHIRRSRPALYVSLQQQGPTRENLRKLRAHCPDCKRLAGSPKHVTAALGFAR